MPVPPATSPPATSPTATSLGSVGDDSWDRQLAPFINTSITGNGTQSTWRDFCDCLHTNLLTRWLPPEAGCVLKTDLFDEAVGKGLCEVLARRCTSVVGIDVSSAAAVAASHRNPYLQTTLCDVRQLAFCAHAFDVVVSNSTLDHFTQPSDITVSLAELHRVTRPGGVLVMTLDNPRHPLVALRGLVPTGLLRRLGLQPYFVGATLSLPSLVAALESVGWRVDDTTTLMHTVRVAAIPAAAWADRTGTTTSGDHHDAATNAAPTTNRFQRWLMAAMMACERLGSLPTRQITGHYVAVRAVRP